MQRIRIKKLLSEGIAGQDISVCGWVRTKRESKGIAFIALNDGSTQDTLQLVIPETSPAFQKLSQCNTGAAIRAAGVLKESPAKGQRFEVEVVSEIEVFGDADPATYPLQKKGHTLEFMREIGHLRPRTNTFGAVLRVRNILAEAVHEFFQDRGFIWVHTPIITASDCEGAGDLFTVTTLDLEKLPKGNGSVDFSQDFFGRRAFLTVSGQLEGEFLAMALGDVYTFGPTFRAENSNTSRHLSEFWMIEPEIAFANLRDDMELAGDFFRFLCERVLEKCESEIAFLEKFYKNTSIAELKTLSEKSFVHISYSDAIKELERAKEKFEFPVKWGLDLQSEHERYLTDKVYNGPVIVTDYPQEIKAFYMRLNDDGKTVAAMDVLVPKIGEIIGGSQREERLDVLTERMRESGIPFENMAWYLDLRRYGSAPHAGFGLGFERLVQYITGMQNIRDVIPCPRAPQTIKF
ncbi:MAG: asparagine--tRNA ligase [Nitrospiraceae bacterium]|nr:MAG: asparagine--tRNA ligase [Nitrospiraceae bacterium]